MPLQFSRHYTLPEAREMIPAVRGWLAELEDLAVRVQQAEDTLRPLLAEGRDLGGPTVGEWIRDLGRTHSVLREFQSRQIQLKNARRGLVDFPALLDGREVFLCWEQSEPDITHWHALDEGFPGRQPLWEVAGD